MQLSEVDLFKLSEKSPIHLKSLESLSRTQYKVWSGLTKFIKSTLQKKQSPFLTEIGKFIPSSPIQFIPSVTFLTSLKVQFKSSPESPSAYPEKSISYTSISEVCSIDRETVILCLKELLSQTSHQLSSNNSIILHFKVGEIKLSRNFSEFIPSPSDILSEKANSLSVDTPRSSRFTTYSNSSSVHPSNPNPLHQGPSTNINNYYRGVKYHSNTSHLAPVAFYTGQIHPIFNFRTKFTRKQAFEQPLSPDELFKFHQEQIKEKLRKRENEKNIETNEFVKTQRLMKETWKNDKETKFVSEFDKRKAYEIANLNQIQEKVLRAALDKEVKKGETYDYFPFVHGDQVEAKTRSLNQGLKDEMQNHLKSVETSPLKLSKEPIVSVPKFLQASEYSTIRRTQNFHVEQTMKGALDSYHKEIKNMEKAKIKEKRTKDEQELNDAIYYKHLEELRRKEISDNLNEINLQINEKVKKKVDESIDKKNVCKTSIEIKENEYDDKDKRKKYYEEYQKYIVGQIQENDWKVKEKTQQERDLDSKILNVVENSIAKEDQEALINEIQAKTLNKDVWMKQMEIRNLEKEVGKLL